MSGLLAVIGKGKDPQLVKELSTRMSHRGPDESDLHIMENGSIICHESLSIIDLKSGKQPIQGTNKAWMVHDGEIYNYQELKDTVLKNHTFRTKSDSEVIVHLYEEFGYKFCNMLDGDFAFVIIDGDNYIAARDAVGVKPLYYGLDERGRIYFSSEMKSIADQCKSFSTFPPGHYYTGKTGFVKYYNPEYEDHSNANKALDFALVRESLIEATRKRLLSEVPVGVILSGGLDTSLISSIASGLLKDSGKKLPSFSIGLDADSPDNIMARKAAEFLGTDHHEIHFTVEEGVAVLEKVIYHIETYDIISVRSSVPMYLLSKAIADQGVKVILSGEGADEIFGGHLYFRNAPSAEEFQDETIERVQKLFTADLLRADKTTMAHGLEARIPFLDKDFLDVAIRVKTEEKQPKTYDGVEKYILRKAFDTPEHPYLPAEVLWRQKEQFSDGVGYSWIDELIEYCATQVSDEQLAGASAEFPYNSPTTKEAYLYRSIFHKFYPQVSAAQTVRKWIPKWQENQDPSGRANAAHLKGNFESVKSGVEV
ncbi:Asparagine synthetase B [glutamine-hydrolyzing] [Flavobacterium bizetiae]|uniref:asparagine synthase (glutamine-hydrolyzing) n=1 Tax=Flavobacterium bizetiae TaxID=2704140 RepID=A0A6J4GUU4_9FLAO|nr:asparagine synthase B [Flavobacterium bizetiae]CAA9202098.1 Asparagine synthetase B [glutamine-hydrolyzing] [Flavobacterium bizetiae]CAD5343371.1 Asparagine synthetase B [glutamine-hydrolyzing] [Flavobacterium bizetiae]CAD5349364.1 Asparagine synthetase B [glutamine-hydrolyzing] [Flavobacterium bizetiae]